MAQFATWVLGRFAPTVTLLLVLGCASPDPGVATSSATAPPTAADTSGIDAMLKAHVDAGATIGMSAFVMHAGQVVINKGYGKRSLEDEAAVAPDTVFAIGSVTKQFTCACVFLLQEDGKLSVEDPVSKWYPKLTRADDIRLIDLMRHTSGYPDYYPLDYVDRRMATPIEPKDLLARYAGGELDFEPGTAWSYSNTGYILLGRVVEKVAGMPFGEVLQSRIFDPLEMTHTLYEPDPADPRLARGYEIFALGPPEPNTPEAPGWVTAAGGIWSTPSDMANWNQAVATGRLLSLESWRAMRFEGVLADGRRTGYGCGIGMPRRHGRQILQHGGAVDGFNAFNAVVPSTGTCVTLLCNQNGGVGTLGNRLLDALLTPSQSVPEVQGPAAVDVVRDVFAAMQQGRIDRTALTTDFDEFMNPRRVAGAAERLAPYGKPEKVEQVAARERGGMEVTTTRLRFAGRAPLRVIMYREPDGKIAEVFVRRD